jgi:hypothetical protein
VYAQSEQSVSARKGSEFLGRLTLIEVKFLVEFIETKRLLESVNVY